MKCTGPIDYKNLCPLTQALENRTNKAMIFFLILQCESLSSVLLSQKRLFCFTMAADVQLWCLRNMQLDTRKKHFPYFDTNCKQAPTTVTILWKGFIFNRSWSQSWMTSNSDIRTTSPERCLEGHLLFVETAQAQSHFVELLEIIMQHSNAWQQRQCHGNVIQ